MFSQLSLSKPYVRTLVFSGSLVLAGCGGGSTTGPSVVPNAQPATPATAATSAVDSASKASVIAVSLERGIHTETFALQDGSPAQLELSVADAPAGAKAHMVTIATPASARKTTLGAESDETFVATLSLNVDANATLDKLPRFVFSRPEFGNVKPGDVSYTLYDGADCTSVIGSKQIASSINGTTATFAPTAGFVTLIPGHSYLFVFSVHTPHVTKFWTVDPVSKAVVGYAINDAQAVLTNTISGPATKLQNPVAVAVTADKQVLALNVNAPANVIDPFPYQFTNNVYAFSLADNGNVTPQSTLQVGGGDEIGSSPNGIRVFGKTRGNRRDGAGAAYSLIPSTDERNLGGSGNFFVRHAAEANDGNLSIVADQSCADCAEGTEEYSVLAIGGPSSRVGVSLASGVYTRHNPDGTDVVVQSIHDHYTADAIALDPTEQRAIVSAVPELNAAPVLDVYSATTPVIGSPSKRYALPAGITSVHAIRTDAVGTVYVLASTASRTQLLIYASAADLSQPMRTVTLAETPGFSANGFAISR